MPCQNSMFIGIRIVMKLPTNIIDTRREYLFLFQRYVQCFFECKGGKTKRVNMWSA